MHLRINLINSMKKILIVLFALISPLCFSQANIFLVTIDNNVSKIEKETISKDETKVYICGAESGIITLVFPAGAGLSGDFVKLTDKKILVVRYVNDELIFSLKKDDGTLKQIIASQVSELNKNDYRINIVSNNLKKAFKISSYETITEDNDAPVMNMFGDKIIPNENEFIITTEIKEAAKSHNFNITSEVQFTGNYFITPVSIEGTEYNFIIDLAATNSFITKRVVPVNTKLEDLVAKQYSADGIQLINSPISGFGGKLNNMQVCSISDVKIAGLQLPGKSFYVIDSFFDIKGKQIDGILGMDILQQFGNLSFEINENKSVPISFGNFKEQSSATLIIPFTIANGHIFIKGKIGSSDVNFIFDTGAPFSFIQSKIAKKENIIGEKSFSVKGADGKEIPTSDAVLNSIMLEGNTIENFKTKIVDSPILTDMGLKESGGLLGNSFLKNYKNVTIDFNTSKIYLYK